MTGRWPLSFVENFVILSGRMKLGLSYHSGLMFDSLWPRRCRCGSNSDQWLAVLVTGQNGSAQT